MNREKLCESEVKKNLILAEIGEPLTLPLATLNRSCEFKKEWDRIQNKWHGYTKEVRAKQKEYHQRPEIKAKKKEYRERPEVKAKIKAKKKEYYQRTKKNKGEI